MCWIWGCLFLRYRMGVWFDQISWISALFGYWKHNISELVCHNNRKLDFVELILQSISDRITIWCSQIASHFTKLVCFINYLLYSECDEIHSFQSEMQKSLFASNSLLAFLVRPEFVNKHLAWRNSCIHRLCKMEQIILYHI